MINIGRWRSVLFVLFPVLFLTVLMLVGQVQVLYKGQGLLESSGPADIVTGDLKTFHSVPSQGVLISLIPNSPSQIRLSSEASSPRAVGERLESFAQACITRSLQARREAMKNQMAVIAQDAAALQTHRDELSAGRQRLLQGAMSRNPNAAILEKIESLKLRRRQLIESYPTHSDIPLLASQIKGLLQKMGGRPPQVLKDLEVVDKKLVEAQLRLDYSTRRLRDMAEAEKSLKPLWRLQRPLQKSNRPYRVAGWPLALAGVAMGVLAAFFGFGSKPRSVEAPGKDGLWVPEPVAAPSSVAPEPQIELKVISPELPSDPLTEKAASLYMRWVEVAKLLYTPSAAAPEGVLDSVTPLLQESSEFLPEGHDVMARYLARSVEPGNLPAHVARTVLMALTGAEEAQVTAEHRLALALAALFHDLAVVPRPASQQEDAGSEVGRLSAVLLRRIPGLAPALLSMVEDILIGMDEFKLETWQNVSHGRTLEPLSKVLREIDRFEKVMQKQRSRLERRIANQ